MADQASEDGTQGNRGLLVAGSALVGFGVFVAFSGVVILSGAAVSATRRWVNQLERPPSELARLRWQQTRAAARAGAEAWRTGRRARPR
jgi:membrane protein implicated in regulation of membrane protease activity